MMRDRKKFWHFLQMSLIMSTTAFRLDIDNQRSEQGLRNSMKEENCRKTGKSIETRNFRKTARSVTLIVFYMRRNMTSPK